MGLLEKAEKYLEESGLNKTNNILINEDELKNIKRVKGNTKPLISKKLIKNNIKKKIKENLGNKNFDTELTPIKIQEEEIDKLFKTKKIKYGNKIEVLDILLSNFKIFQSLYKNHLTFKKTLNFIIKNVNNYLFLTDIYVFSKNFVLMDTDNQIYKKLSKEILENDKYIINETGVINLKNKFKIDEDIFFLKINLYGNLNIYIFFKITLDELKINEYFYDVLLIFFNSILNYLFNLYRSEEIDSFQSLNNFKQTVYKLHKRSLYKILIIKILNFSTILKNILPDDLQNFFTLLDIFYKSFKCINLNYKVFLLEIPHKNTINSDEIYATYEKKIVENIKNNFKTMLEDFNVKIEPVFKIKEISSDDFQESLLSLFLTL